MFAARLAAVAFAATMMVGLPQPSNAQRTKLTIYTAR